jgi:subtilisin family serine protease
MKLYSSFLLLSFLLVQRTAAQQSLVVTFQARPDVSDKTLKALANIAETRVVKVTKTTPLRDLLRAEYGSSIEPIRNIFAKYNGDISTVVAGQELTLPAAPIWQMDAKTRIPRDMRLANFAKVAMGTNGSKTLRGIAAANGVASPTALPKMNAPITLPYAAHTASYPVRSDFPGGIDAIRAKLKELLHSDGALTVAEVTPPYELSPYFVASAGFNCSSKPFVPGANCGVQSITRYAVKQLTTVAVLDSGIAKNDRRFTYWQRGPDLSGGSDLYGDVASVGVNVVTHGGFPVDDVTVPYALNHGTHVAGIASCRLAAADFLTQINDHIHLMILKIAKADATVDPGAVVEAVAYARYHGANIVNMSFEGPSSLAVRSAMDDMKDRILFVAAAGNGRDKVGRNLDGDVPPVYPASFSNALPNVISVAAHDRDFKIACFSNYGASRVDIAAPGTEIESTVVGSTAKLSGTSQATPFVTFAAALLHARGIESPGAIKKRIVYSADYRPELANMVRSDGALNIAKALAYDQDIIRLDDDTLVFGILTPIAPITIPGINRPVPFSAVKKVITAYPGAAGPAVKLFLEGSDLPPTVVSSVNLPNLTIVVDGEAKMVSVAHVREIVPKM